MFSYFICTVSDVFLYFSLNIKYLLSESNKILTLVSGNSLHLPVLYHAPNLFTYIFIKILFQLRILSLNDFFYSYSYKEFNITFQINNLILITHRLIVVLEYSL